MNYRTVPKAIVIIVVTIVMWAGPGSRDLVDRCGGSCDGRGWSGCRFLC